MTYSKLMFLTSLLLVSLAPHESYAQTQQPDLKMIEVPGMGKRELIAPMAKVFEKISPKKDNWDTESYNEAASAQLYKFAAALKSLTFDTAFKDIVHDSFQSSVLIPESSSMELVQKQGFEIYTWKPSKIQTQQNIEQLFNSFTNVFSPNKDKEISTKIFKITPGKDNSTLTNVLVEFSGASDLGHKQINAEWECEWKLKNEKPLLHKIKLLSYQQITSNQNKGAPLFVDQTQFVLGENESLKKQLLHSSNHWRARIPQNMGLDVASNHGFLLADLNGDDLEDLYLSQQGGLPNLLYIRQPDGSFLDASTESGVNLLDYSASALALDLDKDGDRDLIVALQFELLLMNNNGNAKFKLAARVPLRAQTFSLSAADYDLDGDLDIYTCGYNPTLADLEESGTLGSPTPYHDANNGGQNTLLENIGSFTFKDVTETSGIDQNNTRFSFAASWEDYDQDGDPDLYVANDYGRNNLYRNDGGKFVDVAKELNIEDMSSGMSVSWGDLNRDGRSDLYVSNMFSSAGNRVTFQNQFQDGKADDTSNAFQRFARGSTLFQGTENNGFEDISIESNTSMARWAWGSRFADLNNDGWEDILATNGFISTPKEGDL